MTPVIAAFALIVAQDGTIAPDRGTYDELVGCAASTILYSANERVRGRTEAAENAIVTFMGYRSLAFLYGAPLGLGEAEVKAAIDVEVDRKVAVHGPTLDSATPELAEQVLVTDQAVCAAVLARVSAAD